MSPPTVPLPAPVTVPTYGPPPLLATILAATAGSPVPLTTAAPHGLSTGQTYTITGIQGLSGVEGSWPVTVTGTNTFTVPTTGVGTYAGGGQVLGRPPVTGSTTYTTLTSVPAPAQPAILIPVARVLSASNATPIVITTDVTLPCSSVGGSQIATPFTIAGVAGNTAANGVVVCSPLGGNAYGLYTATPGGLVAIAGNGAYAGGGTVSLSGVVTQGLGGYLTP